MPYALITGASGGIGYELAKLFAKDGNDLILVARNERKLEEVKQELMEAYGIDVVCLSCDLSADGACDELYEKTRALGIEVESLVNNAGYGDCAAFLDADYKKLENMVRLNVLALMRLTYLYGRDMRDRRKGRILNLASIAGFCSGPYMATYFSSKNFVLSFSDALFEELKGSGVSITVVCPGPTRTNFESAADLKSSKMFKVMKVADADSLARYAYRCMNRGKALGYYDFSNRALNFLCRIFPRSVVRRFTASVNIPRD
ncbi:MAG: SDR family oxidoreductase [Clostridia bacterium]|nr:SDR family oxidoreductase [Clostridia bacterium]